MARLTSRLTTVGVVLAALLALSLGALVRPAERSAAAPLAANPRTLVVATNLSDAKTMDPGHSYEFSSVRMEDNVYEGLITYHGSDVSHAVGLLASSWKVTGGGSIFTFTLRHGVRFSNGDPMTANDVVFSYRRLGYLDDNPAPQMGAAIVGGTLTIFPVKALDKYTVQFALPQPNASFLSTLSSTNFGVTDEKVVRAHGGDDSPDAKSKDTALDWLNEHSAGTGPFVLTNWTRGASGQIVMKRNKNYWGKKPSLDEIILEGVSDTTAERLEVSRGTVDVATQIDIDGAKALRHDSNVKVVTGNTLDLIYMGMTLNPDISKPLSDPRVRQAVRYALDYNGIIKGLLSGVGTQPAIMIPEGLLGSDPATTAKLRPKRNLTLARKLLADAGYPNGFSVKLEYPGGYIFDGINMDLVAPKVAHDLADIGITATLAPEDFSVILPAYRAQKIAMILFVWGSDYPDSNDYATFFSPCTTICPARRMWYVKNDQLVSLVNQANSTGNPTKRAALYKQIQRIWLQESPWVGVVQPQNIVVLHRGVTGYRYNVINLAADYRYVRKSG